MLERYGNGKMSVPATAADYKLRSQYLYWLHWAEVSDSARGGPLLSLETEAAVVLYVGLGYAAAHGPHVSLQPVTLLALQLIQSSLC